jgi:hypothetical protein
MLSAALDIFRAEEKIAAYGIFLESSEALGTGNRTSVDLLLPEPGFERHLGIALRSYRAWP